MTTSLLISYAVLFIHATTWEGQIWEDVGNWLDRKLPEWLSKPLYGCPICMSFWWGFVIVCLLQGFKVAYYNGIENSIIVFAAGGVSVINVIICKWYQRMIDEEDAK
jgi:hypothetical protein